VKLRRFSDAGVAAVRETLPKIEETGDLSLAAALVTDENKTEFITELSDLDLDPLTTHAFCEYFHSLIFRKSRVRNSAFVTIAFTESTPRQQRKMV